MPIIRSRPEAIERSLDIVRSALERGEDIQILYNRAFQSISQVLKRDGIAVVGLSDNEMISAGEKYFTLIDTYKFKVHRSMTRYFAVYKK